MPRGHGWGRVGGEGQGAWLGAEDRRWGTMNSIYLRASLEERAEAEGRSGWGVSSCLSEMEPPMCGMAFSALERDMCFDRITLQHLLRPQTLFT